jgi:hypothetical protein
LSTALGDRLNQSRHFQYTQLNGPNNLFLNYKSSLDVVAKHAYEKVDDVQRALVTVLVVEAVVVNILALAYLYVLLRNVGAQHMISFATLLAVPSAVMRAMASRPCKVGGMRSQPEGLGAWSPYLSYHTCPAILVLSCASCESI